MESASALVMTSRVLSWKCLALISAHTIREVIGGLPMLTNAINKGIILRRVKVYAVNR